MKNQHLVPQVMIDCAENLAKSLNENSKTTYAMRLEAIRDYCDQVLKKQTNSIVHVKKRNSSR
jgi:hypothetical protein